MTNVAGSGTGAAVTDPTSKSALYSPVAYGAAWAPAATKVSSIASSPVVVGTPARVPGQATVVSQAPASNPGVSMSGVPSGWMSQIAPVKVAATPYNDYTNTTPQYQFQGGGAIGGVGNVGVNSNELVGTGVGQINPLTGQINTGDSNAYVNPLDPNGRINTLVGIIDPTTGQIAYDPRTQIGAGVGHVVQQTPQAYAGNVMQGADAARNVILDNERQNQAAAAESAIARGMGRSGIYDAAQIAEDYKAQLAIQQAYGDAAAKQGELDAGVSQSNAGLAADMLKFNASSDLTAAGQNAGNWTNILQANATNESENQRASAANQLSAEQANASNYLSASQQNATTYADFLKANAAGSQAADLANANNALQAAQFNAGQYMGAATTSANNAVDIAKANQAAKLQADQIQSTYNMSQQELAQKIWSDNESERLAYLSFDQSNQQFQDTYALDTTKANRDYQLQGLNYNEGQRQYNATAAAAAAQNSAANNLNWAQLAQGGAQNAAQNTLGYAQLGQTTTNDAAQNALGYAQIAAQYGAGGKGTTLTASERASTINGVLQDYNSNGAFQVWVNQHYGTVSNYLKSLGAA